MFPFAVETSTLDFNSLANLGGTVAVTAMFVWYLSTREKMRDDREIETRKQVSEAYVSGQEHVEKITAEFTKTIEINAQHLKSVSDAHVALTRDTVAAIVRLSVSVDSLRDDMRASPSRSRVAVPKE